MLGRRSRKKIALDARTALGRAAVSAVQTQAAGSVHTPANKTRRHASTSEGVVAWRIRSSPADQQDAANASRTTHPNLLRRAGSATMSAAIHEVRPITMRRLAS